MSWLLGRKLLSDEESVIRDALASVVRCVGSIDTLLLPILPAVVATETCILPQVCSGTLGLDASWIVVAYM